MAQYLIGLDNGGTVTKAGLYDTAGNELSVATRNTAMLFPRAGHTERDLNELWKANTEAIRQVIQTSGVSPDDIVGIAVTGHGNGVYLLGGDGAHITNGVVSTDTRAIDYVERWKADGTAQTAYQQTVSNVWAGQPPPLLAWYRDNQPEVLEQTRHVICCKDYVRFRLTGQIASEMTDLSGTSLMNVRDGVIDPGLLDVWGLSFVREWIPAAIWPTSVAGTITEEASVATGLKKGTVVAGGLFDIVAMALATGVFDPHQLCVIGGTWSINEFVSSEPVESDEIAMNSLYCLPGKFLVNDSTPTSASNFEWFVANLLSYGSYGVDRTKLFEDCNSLVAATTPDEADVVFLPFLFGSNVHPRATSAFIGLAGWHETRHLVRAVYEGVVFSHRTHIDRLRRHSSRGFDVARISGGLTRSEVWVQMFADVLQLPIETTEGEELGCRGAAMTAGVAAGVYDSLEIAAKRMVRKKAVILPRSGMKDRYDEKYAGYRQAIDALKSLW